MRNFSRTSACLLTGLLAAGAVGATATAASAGTIAKCSSAGTGASCVTGGQVSKPVTLTVTVTSSPAQSVFVAWNDQCTQGSTTKKESGTFTATTPVTRVIPHAFKQPGSCVVAAAGGITGTGTVKVTLSSSSAAPAHEIKGFASLCASDPGNATAAGTKVETAACTNAAAEQWAFSHGELVHRGMCMADKSNAGNGGKVVLARCTGAASQVWTHNAHQEYVLKSHGGTLCLTDPGSARKKGTQLVVATCRNSASQHWTLP